MSTVTLAPATRLGRTGTFLRRFLELAVAAAVGMVAFGAVVGWSAAAVGSGLDRIRLEQPGPFALGMALAMSLPAVAWMRRRGHGWRSAAELTVAIVLPAVALAVCHALGWVGADRVLPIAGGAVLAAVLVAMLLRREEYAGG